MCTRAAIWPTLSCSAVANGCDVTTVTGGLAFWRIGQKRGGIDLYIVRV